MQMELGGEATQQLSDPQLCASAWRHLAELVEQCGDDSAAASAWKQATLAR